MLKIAAFGMVLFLAGAGCQSQVSVSTPPSEPNVVSEKSKEAEPTDTVVKETVKTDSTMKKEETKTPNVAEMKIEAKTEAIVAPKVEAKVEAIVPPVVLTPRTEAFFIEAKQWEFVPATITVNKGSKVQLVFQSKDVTHGVSLPAFGKNASLSPGQRVEMEFIADKTGTFPFTCSVFCGEGHGGMAGTLIVKE